MDSMQKLSAIRAFGGNALTKGLSDDVVARFLCKDASLRRAIDEAFDLHREFVAEYGDALRRDECELARWIQDGYVNFYAADAVNPYVALAARGPWIVTIKGAVIHDNGGYGMLGFGHNDQRVLDTMARPRVMANIMTPSVSQKRLIDRLRREIGHSRPGHAQASRCPWAGFLCLNSGSEAVTVAARITDIHAKNRIDRDANPERVLKFVTLKGSFHGRTDRPGELSDSSRKSYAALASYRHKDNLLTVTPNDLDDLRRVFAEADRSGVMIEAMFMEPVMGEGNPGQSVTPEFYGLARELTAARGAMLVIDSIQAGLRAHGTLSIVDYPGFESCDPPDMETYSKAINAGQYPLSVLAMGELAAKTYKVGVYGNTMTTNPRAIEVACTVLDAITPEVRRNIRERGREFVDKLLGLGREMPGTITGAQGTGLLLSCALDPKLFKAYGAGSIEDYMRRLGIGVIHGGEASLRFTPHFMITSDEIDLVIDHLRVALREGPRVASGA